MSLFLPKRISELATIDSDLETPEKAKNKHFMKNVAVMPKRMNDIKDSDSEDEDKLNCAILNDSFVLSPSKDVEYEFSSTCKLEEQQNNKENLINNQNISKTHEKRFDSVDLSREEVSKYSSSTLANGFSNRPQLKSRTELFPPSHSKNYRKNEPQSFKAPASKAANVDATDETLISLSVAKETISQNMLMETPHNKFNNPQHMITPSSTRLYSCIDSNSMLTNIENVSAQQLQYQVQQPKILFRTPVARPFTSSTSTVIDTKAVSSIQKLSPIKEPVRDKPKENCITIKNINYKIEKKIGAGGSSSVFLAKACKSGKECAIKLVHLDGDSQVIEGYLNETRLLEKLQGNINVVALYDYCHLPEKKILYMVMEKGETDLHKALQKFTSHIPLYTLMSYWHQMLQAVNYIHQNGVIHSDLKPANFCLIGGRLKLIDFGIASSIANDSTSIIKSSQAGTFNYISPEALIDTSNDDSPSTHHQPKIRLSTKSDVWSLGCILYLLIYMKTPFSHIKSLHQKIQAITNPQTMISYPKLPIFYPEMLQNMLKNCLVYNPKERSSVADLLKYPFNMIIPIDKE